MNFVSFVCWLSSAVFNLLRAVATDVLRVFAFVSRFSTLLISVGSISFHEGISRRMALSTFWTFSILAFAVLSLLERVCLSLTFSLYFFVEEVRAEAKSFGDSIQSAFQFPTINDATYSSALLTSPALDSTSALAVEILPLHSLTAFSASGTFSANDSTCLRFVSKVFRSALTSNSFFSPALIWASSSLNVLLVDSSRVLRADRVVDSTSSPTMSSNFSIPQALHASNAFNSALATDLSSLNALRSRSCDFDSDLISASSFTFASTNFLCSFSASSYASFNPPTRAANSSSRGSADLIS